MAIFSTCDYPWIDTEVKNYVFNTSQIDNYDNPTYLTKCCLGPGECTSARVDTCPYAFLSCNMGNSRYACNLMGVTSNGPSCNQEGTLANTRNLPCCNPILTSFLQEPGKCLPSNYNSFVCCTDSSDVGTCDWAICIGYESLTCISGEKTAVCFGASSCINEYTLGASDCPAVTAPATGCTLGGSGPVYVPTNNITATSLPMPTASGPSMTNPSATGPGKGGPSHTNAGEKSVITGKRGILTLCVLVPLLSQLLFL